MALPTLDATFASSADLPRKQMLAKWLVEELGETQAPSSVAVSGLDVYNEVDPNGNYSYSEISTGRPKYINETNDYIEWSGDQWLIRFSNEDVLFYSYEDVAYPWLVINWTANNGTGIPVVAEIPQPSPLSNYYSLPEHYLWAKIAVAAGGPKTEADYISLPKNYAWSDIYNAVSGDIANSAVVVSGAGTSSSNGTYVKTGFSDGKPIYNFGLNTIAWSSADSYWYIFDDEVVGDVVYFSFDDTSYPWEATGWNIESGGASPAPTLTPKTPNHTDWSEKQALGHIAAAYRGDTATPANLATYIDWPWRYQVAAIIDGFVVVLTSSFVYDDGAPVTSVFGAIPNNWQEGNTDIDQLVLGTSATSIGSNAFYNCSSLAGSLTIPNSVTSIGSRAFYNCTGFTGSLTLGSSLTTIDSNAFYNCVNLTGPLTIPNSVTSIDSGAFYNCTGFTGSLTISGTTSIGSYSFYGVSFDGLNVTGTSISSYQFNNAQYVSGSLSIANTITTIGSYAFNSPSNLTGSLTIPNSVTSISSYAFQGCSGFTSLSIGSGLTSIGNGAFKSCSGLTGSLTIPNSVTSIGASAFQSCSGLTGSLTISNSVTSIGVSAFQSCSGLTGALTIPNSVTSIGVSAFLSCSGLTGSLTISNSVTSIGASAFRSCSGFTGNLTIPNSVTSIGNEAFRSCSGFTGNLTIPNSVTFIGIGTFQSCSGLTTVLCYVTRTIMNFNPNALLASGVTTIRARASDATWTAGSGQTVGGKTGITVIKDL